MVWHSGQASLPSGSQWLHSGQLWMERGGAGVSTGPDAVWVAEFRIDSLSPSCYLLSRPSCAAIHWAIYPVEVRELALHRNRDPLERLLHLLQGPIQHSHTRSGGTRVLVRDAIAALGEKATNQLSDLARVQPRLQKVFAQISEITCRELLNWNTVRMSKNGRPPLCQSGGSGIQLRASCRLSCPFTRLERLSADRHPRFRNVLGTRTLMFTCYFKQADDLTQSLKSWTRRSPADATAEIGRR